MARKKSAGKLKVKKVKAFCPYCRTIRPAEEIGYLLRCTKCGNRID